MPVRLAIADDYPLVVAGLRAMLEPFAARVHLHETDGRCGPGQHDHLDVVLYDPAAAVDGPPFDPPCLCGITSEPPRLVVFSWQGDPDRIKAALRCGADAQLSKALPPAELVDAVERINRGEWIGMHTTGPTSAAADLWPGAEQGLSGRESEVLVWVCQGLSNREIAERAQLSINTVKTYIRSCYRKIGASTRPQAVIWAMAHGFISGRKLHHLDPAVTE